jgi:hypothetical protein
MPRRENGHRKARLLYPTLGTCERDGCTEQAVDRHHIDGNTFHNERSNVMFLCRACHMIIDGRMKVIHTKDKKPPKTCINCGELKKPMRHGRCHTCNEYLRRHGIERPYKVDGRVEKKVDQSTVVCPRCKRHADCVGRPRRGYCGSCYTYLTKRGLIETRKRREREIELGQLDMFADVTS